MHTVRWNRKITLLRQWHAEDKTGSHFSRRLAQHNYFLGGLIKPQQNCLPVAGILRWDVNTCTWLCIFLQQTLRLGSFIFQYFQLGMSPWWPFRGLLFGCLLFNYSCQLDEPQASLATTREIQLCQYFTNDIAYVQWCVICLEIKLLLLHILLNSLHSSSFEDRKPDLQTSCRDLTTV